MVMVEYTTYLSGRVGVAPENQPLDCCCVDGAAGDLALSLGETSSVS
jgi:hypothetical protein